MVSDSQVYPFNPYRNNIEGDIVVSILKLFIFNNFLYCLCTIKPQVTTAEIINKIKIFLLSLIRQKFKGYRCDQKGTSYLKTHIYVPVILKEFRNHLILHVQIGIERLQ